ncbi:tetratricopeptide repeat protein [Nocardia caishijiensis]|uniref:Tetratricopeptide repeat protein n=1 Tax=Nocardia caishijiensis TaxID=184756 RepID=A0ABQ6YLZ1_9NOCA|nr:hypothetical protein [Nocardia caishijiensis]KAF0846809.1 hypothetical protein FNL39_104231 [Nocardia caishijiensis]
MTIELNDARGLLAQGDLGGSVRSLRPIAEQLPLPELVTFLIELADAAELERLATSARAALPDATDPRALTMLGYDCVEYGLSFAAVPVLRESLRVDSTVRQALAELVAALEDEHRHAEAVEVLLRYSSSPREWAEHYLLVYNSILSGDPATARAEFAALAEPDDDWVFARDRVGRMLIRAERAAAVSTLDDRDLRGWQFTLTGGYLATMSPYGFDAGMTGRWAYLGDSATLCRRGIDRLGLALSAAGRTPRTVSLLPDRPDRILGLATGQVLGLPTQEYEPGAADTLVVAYDLRTVDPDLVVTLHERTPGQILFEHATCWTQPAPVTADISGLLHQTVIAPWAATQRVGDNGLEPVPADTRPESEIAADIAAADPTPDPGDGETPPDPDTTFTTFVAATAETWLHGPRTPVRSPGPVRSSYFA